MTEKPDEHLPSVSDPAWLETAFQELGVREIPGNEHNGRVVQYHACTGLGATDDETPWCSSFICWVMEQAGHTTTRSAASLSWLRWGKTLDKPRRGCVVVFERVDGNGKVIPNQGHVALYLYEKAGYTYVLGGNQGNQVKVSGYSSDRVVGYRWPSTPIRSTTNIASATAAIGSVTAAAPTMIEMLRVLTDNGDDVRKVMDTAKTISTNLGVPVSSGIAMVGLAVALAAMIYVIRERNLKIIKLGI